MEIDAIAAVAAAATAAVSLIGSQSIRAVVSAIFRRPKHDSVVVQRPDGDVEVIDVDALPKLGHRRGRRSDWDEG